MENEFNGFPLTYTCKYFELKNERSIIYPCIYAARENNREYAFIYMVWWEYVDVWKYEKYIAYNEWYWTQVRKLRNFLRDYHITLTETKKIDLDSLFNPSPQSVVDNYLDYIPSNKDSNKYINYQDILNAICNDNYATNELLLSLFKRNKTKDETFDSYLMRLTKESVQYIFI